MMAMSAPYLPVLVLALLLQACTTTGGPATKASTDGETAVKGQPQAHRTPVPPALIEAAEPDFKGPQVVFAPGSAELPRTASSVLDDIAAKLKADPLVNVMLVGHTEDLGSSEFSMAVASKCTQAVGQALIKRGARPSQIRMQPRGHEKTVAKRCTSAACKKQMRRVDIVLSTY
jgi:outer membrane protein OmpA-like peptidoglycan-associated protein